MRKQHLVVLVAIVAVVAFGHSAQAATFSRQSELVVPAFSTSVNIFSQTYKGGASIAAADTTGDGTDEFIVGSGLNGKSQVQILSRAGDVLQAWTAYGAKVKGGVNVAAGDLDGDGLAEVVTVPNSGSAAAVNIYDQGVFVRNFLAFPSSYKNGASVAVISAHASNQVDPNIIVSSHGGRADTIRVYTPAGRLVDSWVTHVTGDLDVGVTIAAGWSDTWQEPIVVVGAGRGAAPRVELYGLWSKKVLASWLAFNKKVTTGVNVGYRDGMIAVAQQGMGQPVVREFTDLGERTDEVAVFEPTFRGGINVALASDGISVTLAAVPTAVTKTQATGTGKEIHVSLSKQLMTLVENGQVISSRRVSTGKWSTPTPIGTFQTHNKMLVAYSAPYHLYMEYWMAITPDGQYGLHALPFWKLKNGGKLYEGAAHIGTPVSHGCIRQTVADAKSLYDWAPIGTPVIITK